MEGRGGGGGYRGGRGGRGGGRGRGEGYGGGGRGGRGRGRGRGRDGGYGDDRYQRSNQYNDDDRDLHQQMEQLRVSPRQSSGGRTQQGGGRDQSEPVSGRIISGGEGSSRDSGHGGGGWVNFPRRWEMVPSPASQPPPSESKMASPDPRPLDNKEGIIPMHRPDKGGSRCIGGVRLRVNHFIVKYEPERVIMHYDVDVKPVNPPKQGRPVRISKSDLSAIRDKLFSDKPLEFPLSMTAYDGEKNIFSAVPLPTGKFRVEVSRGEDARVRSYIFSIKLVNELKMGKLNDYMNGRLLSIPRDILQGMDLVMKENPTRNMISVGRSFYPKLYDPRDDLGRGISAYKGFQHSLKPTSQGLSLCLDYSVLAFRKPMPVLDFLVQHIHGFRINEFWNFKDAVETALKELKVYVTHRDTKQKFVIKGLADRACDSVFSIEDPDGQHPPRNVRLVEYFREKYHKNIVHVNIPCLALGTIRRKNDVPMEFCEIVEGQRFQKEDLYGLPAKQLKELSLPKPHVREQRIREMVRSSDGPCGGAIAQNFGIEVNPNMSMAEGRVIGPPQLKARNVNGNLETLALDGEKCQWNFVRRLVIQGKPIDKWVVLEFCQGGKFTDRFNNKSTETYSRNLNLNLNPDEFIPKLIRRCENLGIRMKGPLFYKPAQVHELSSVDKVRKVLESVRDEASKHGGGHLQLVLCVMPKRDKGYKFLKWISETKIGVVTQCCLTEHAKEAKDQYLANLALKINAKLGGSNVELSNQLPIVPTAAGHVMFVGADVNHPGSMNRTSPSIAAVVATMNWPASNRYAARVRAQYHRTEKIVDFGAMCKELIECYDRLNKVKPEKIIIFRDGVSEGQFDMVLNEELFDFRMQVCTRDYSPTVTLIVARKRHQTRLFPASRNDACSSGNVPPGTVVDTKVVHPFEFDFYLCSHYGSLGTSKPTHYHVLYDQHKFSSDQLQKLIYDMCFTMARCTKPVSLVPPVYYADLVAYRGRLYHETVTDPSSSGSSSLVLSSPASPIDQSFFKLHADLENEMFFI